MAGTAGLTGSCPECEYMWQGAPPPSCPNCGHELAGGPDEAPARGREVSVRDIEAARAGVQALVRAASGRDCDGDMAATPDRVVRAMMEMTAGYDGSPAEVLATTFEPGDDDVSYDEMIVLRNVEFCSLCEHHLLPFAGVATVAYVPGDSGRVVGLSKLARLVDLYACRFQMQERMTWQVARALEEHLGATAAACIVRAGHQCMRCRGVRKGSAEMVTSVLLGRFRGDDAARAELMALSL